MPKSRGRKNKKGRRVQMTPRVADLLQEQRLAFVAKFGREPGPGDPVFFDPDADVPTEMSPVKAEADLLATMHKAGLPPEIIYAFRKTGLLGFGDQSAWPSDRRKEWDDAIQQYRAVAQSPKPESVPDPQAWSTEIPELLASPLSREEYEQVVACLRAMDPLQSPGMTVGARMELAAALLADACSSAYQAVEALGRANEGPAQYTEAEDLVLRRARELYAQGRA
jgi:hypothetical protein